MKINPNDLIKKKKFDGFYGLSTNLIDDIEESWKLKIKYQKKNLIKNILRLKY